MGTPPQLASQAGPAPSAPPPELSPSSFRVLHTIGEGAFSVVRLAERGKERWALKFTRKPTGRGPAAGDARAAVVRELGFLRSLPPHPHVVGCAGYFTAGDEEACLVQEFAPNGDLREALSGGEPLPAEDAALVARQVAAALAHLHAHGVAHGDLKPENILFGGRGQAMLCDFGSAVLIEAAEAEEGAERYQGTPQYQAPGLRGAGAAVGGPRLRRPQRVPRDAPRAAGGPRLGRRAPPFRHCGGPAAAEAARCGPLRARHRCRGPAAPLAGRARAHRPRPERVRVQPHLFPRRGPGLRCRLPVARGRHRPGGLHLQHEQRRVPRRAGCWLTWC
eukprot:TRINITY_DN17410_c0_g1_i1.p2 TRINITY_DN17410_c0_g1~~TRINITY_DN17410_c0_g1_i1.p2  ORF type:complete len:356 (+),score=49.59 TRINITY_DN17410_c0_g1_i1:69-1070(+)